MEALLRPLVTATGHTNEFKNQILQKIFSNLDWATIGAADCAVLFKLFAEWILSSNEDQGEGYLIRHGHKELTRLAKERPDAFRDYISPNVLIDIFTNNLHSNKAETVVLVGEILTLLETDESANQEYLRSITNISRSHVANFLRDHAVHLNVASALGKLYQAHPDLLPLSADARLKIAQNVVKALGGYRTPSVIDEDFLNQSEEFSQILPLIWSRPSGREIANDGLHLFYSLISTGDSYSRPSCAMLSIIDKVPALMLDSAMSAMIERKPVHEDHDEGRTVTALQTMIEWLTQRPSVLISTRIVQLLEGLHQSKRDSVLIEISHASVEKLLQSLPVSRLQDSVQPIFFYLLLGFQHSETVFHQIVTSLPGVLKQLHKSAIVQSLKSEAKPKSREILERLAESVYFLMDRFSGFPELYDSVLKWLQKSAMIPPTPERCEELKSLTWISCPDQQHIPSISKVPNERLNVLRLNTAAAARSGTGMAGLINLGNTCYMNSVLQALFITRSFCDQVFSAPTSSTQIVLSKLQLTFAFLRNTQRAIYSPSDLLRAARPPWFESGRQQDCSEFLRYLLDTLHEQEKRGCESEDKKKGFRGACLPRRQVSATTLSSTAESEEEIVMAKVKPSFSTTALDAISESPENVGEKSEDTRPKEGFQLTNNLSEGVVFGSRGSLGGGPSIRRTPVDSDSEEEEVDMLGSRGSLSGSLCRWTTEENLSFAGSQDKMDLADGSLHDTHSNSTDSGIQSVGDSIRGSSDSVTNKEADIKSRQLKVKPSHSPGNPVTSMVEKVFGGRLRIKYQCSNCNKVSTRCENFTDLNLAVPSAKEGDPRTIQRLMDDYLRPEQLCGDNQYHCDKCARLHDAVKETEVIDGPSHLMCTLMRFHYDRDHNRKTKICTKLKYEESLVLPTEKELNVEYSLYAVVVHSGYSSDGGHYYTYAREPHVPDVWYIFNDSKVSFSSFNSFASLSTRFPVDTAYVLFYHRKDIEQSGPPPPLRLDLRLAVDKDNLLFLREKERSSSLTSSSSTRRDKGDDDNEDGPGFSGGCGSGSSFNEPGRFVC